MLIRPTLFFTKPASVLLKAHFAYFGQGNRNNEYVQFTSSRNRLQVKILLVYLSDQLHIQQKLRHLTKLW